MTRNTILAEIADERQHQLDVGFSTEHDSQWNMEQLPLAATYYATPARMRDQKDWMLLGKPKHSVGYHGRRSELIKAAALLLAELERISPMDKGGKINETCGKDRQSVESCGTED